MEWKKKTKGLRRGIEYSTCQLEKINKRKKIGPESVEWETFFHPVLFYRENSSWVRQVLQWKKQEKQGSFEKRYCAVRRHCLWLTHRTFPEFRLKGNVQSTNYCDTLLGVRICRNHFLYANDDRERSSYYFGYWYYKNYNQRS